MNVAWHPNAERELGEAASFYNGRVPGLGQSFVSNVEAAAQRIVDNPEGCPIVEGEIRRRRVHRFPYCIYYRVIDNSIRILGINHHSRNLDDWHPPN